VASELRNLGASVEYRLWQLLYEEGWYVCEENVALTPLKAEGDVPPRSFAGHRQFPWVWWSSSGQNPSRQHITVYSNGVPVSPSAYTVNFPKGYISFHASTTGTITADYSHYTVNVIESDVDGEPSANILEMKDLPLVAYDCGTMRNRPWAVGTVGRESTYPVNCYVYGRTKGERDDLTHSIVSRAISFQLLDASGAWLWNDKGDVNSNFNFGLQSQGFFRMGRDPSGTKMKQRANGSDKERFRSVVTFDLVMAHA
jgi:hypothetical protein